MKVKLSFLGYVFSLLSVIPISSCSGFLDVVDALASIDTSSSSASPSTSSFTSGVAHSSIISSTSAQSAQTSTAQSAQTSTKINQLQNNIRSKQAEYDNLDVELARMKEANKNATSARSVAKAQTMRKNGNNYGSVNNMTRSNVAKAGNKYAKPYSQDMIMAHTKRMSDLRIEIASLKNQLATLEGGRTTETGTSQKKSVSTSDSKGRVCVLCGGSGVCMGKYKCNGTGKCDTCNGKGYFIVTGDNVACPNCASNHNGKCSRCNGSGKCSSCNGTGYR